VRFHSPGASTNSFLETRKPEGTVVEFNGKPVRIVKHPWKTARKSANIRHVRFHDYDTRSRRA
jgi:hypothetical protein